MSSEPPNGPNPFEGWPMFGDLARWFGGQGPVNWDVARQTAQWIATDGVSEPNVEPLERLRLEELLRAADLHVGEATGLSTSIAGGVLSVLPVTRGDWALHSMEAHRSPLERLAKALGDSPLAAPEPEPDPTTDLLGGLGKILVPVLLGVQSGYMVGHLARRSMGQYDLPLPRMAADQLLVVPTNMDAFATEWSLPGPDLRMWVCLREVATHAVLGRPHVRARLLALVDEYVSRFEVNPDAVEQSFGDLDPTDPAAIQRVLGNPETLLGAIQTDAQREVLVRLGTLTTTVAGYVDHVMDLVGHGLVGAYQMVTEAMRRRRVEASEGDRFAGRLLGLALDRGQYEKGAAFAEGVVDRAGEEGLARLWHSERELPTPAELDAPGLWLARIDLPE
ncbi:MAG: zinc-dependent metalloprotease [Acidimicrobiales bacterium]